MAFLPVVIAVALVVVAWQFVSYAYPDLFYETPIRLKNDSGGVITPQLVAFIEKILALNNITGLSVAVVPKNGPAEFHTWGYRTEDGDEVTPDTLFHMASVSKAFCSTALGLLVDDFANGKNVTALPSGLTELTWYTRLSELLPDWQLIDEWASQRVNLRDILSHMSGLPRHDDSYGPSDTPEKVITRLKYLRPAFELREQWSYSNIMYMVATHVITVYSGQSYTSFVEERIFTPLGMTSSTFSPAKAEASGNFTQGWTKEGRRVPATFPEDTAFLLAGPGGVISNAVDMNVSYSYAVSNVDFPSNPKHSIVGYGMGWFRSSHRGHDIVYHGGSLPWLSTLVSFLPRDRIGVILFANGEDKPEALALIQNRILDLVLHLPVNSLSIPMSHPSPKVTKTHICVQNLTLSLDTFAGTYTNPGYGVFTLCSSSSMSSYCARVLSDFEAIDSVRGHPDSKDLLAEWPGLWTSHVRLRHQETLVFEIDFTSLYPHGYGKDARPFESQLTHRLAEFVIENGEVVGFGINDPAGELTERARKHETVQDRAEVWFERV